jgi:hypothetical protein
MIAGPGVGARPIISRGPVSTSRHFPEIQTLRFVEAGFVR